MISTSPPSTEIFAFLMSSFHIFPASALISVFGSMDLITFSPSTTTRQRWRCQGRSAKRRTQRPMPPPQYIAFIRSPVLSDLPG